MLSLLLRLNIEASQLVGILRAEAGQLASTVAQQQRDLQRNEGQLTYVRESEVRQGVPRFCIDCTPLSVKRHGCVPLAATIATMRA